VRLEVILVRGAAAIGINAAAFTVGFVGTLKGTGVSLLVVSGPRGHQATFGQTGSIAGSSGERLAGAFFPRCREKRRIDGVTGNLLTNFEIVARGSALFLCSDLRDGTPSNKRRQDSMPLLGRQIQGVQVLPEEKINK